jgi:sterol desaturase/sphingolipid hydroxylase (fatty acid hydroxylase superfamily)
MSADAILTWAIPAFIFMMLLEYAAWRRTPRGKGYEAKDTAASIAMGLGYFFLGLLTKAVGLAGLVWLHQFRLFDIPEVWWAWPLLILAEDHAYYWFHRVHHEVRMFWAAHVNHHSSRHYNLSTALRQSWTTPITGPIFWAPLALIGFEPMMIVLAQVISLLYQFFLHTELVDKLGPLEWVLNTPSHHRVHHGRNEQYLDKNYGGIFIIYDRLYRTFEPERETVDYGLTTNLETFNPVLIAFHEWRDMLRDAWRARGLRNTLGHVFMSPAWKPTATLTHRHTESTTPGTA